MNNCSSDQCGWWSKHRDHAPLSAKYVNPIQHQISLYTVQPTNVTLVNKSSSIFTTNRDNVAETRILEIYVKQYTEPLNQLNQFLPNTKINW